MSRAYIERIRLGPTVIVDGASTLIGTVPISKVMAGVATGTPLSMCFLDARCFHLFGADNPDVYGRIIRMITPLGLDGSTYLLDASETIVEYDGGVSGTASVTLNGSNIEFRMAHSNENPSITGNSRGLILLESVRAFDI